MTPTSYEEIVESIQGLTPAQQMRLLQELSVLLRPLPSQPKRSIMELAGLGKEVWAGIDAQDYVDQERASWNG